MRELAAGIRLAGRYTLEKRLGRGGMGETWRAQDKRANAPVALKILDAERAASAAARERFHAEWRTASRLMHPHIVRMFEYHDEPDGPLYAQQFLDGPSIAALSGMPLEQVLRPVGLLADALRYAHGKQIVHSDLCAANVLLDARGAPYLIDFGVARTTGETGGGGTPAAMSPAQQAGAPAAQADDIYALGVLVHELLFGAPPAGAEIPRETLAGETLPGSVRDLLAAMLHPDAAKRPDAETIAARLDEAGFPAGAARLPGTSVGSDAAEISVQATRRARPAVAAAAEEAPAARGLPASWVLGGLGVLLLLLVGVVFLLPAGVDAPAPEAAPAAQTAEEPAQDALPGDPATDDAETPTPSAPVRAADSDAAFSENVPAVGTTDAARLRAQTDEALGDLLSRLERLRYRGIERWGGQEYLDAIARYEAGDAAYLDRDYATALEHYQAATAMLEPFLDRIDDEFRKAMRAAAAAFEARDHREAIRLYDLAVAITPGNAAAERGLARARNLENVLALMRTGEDFEEELDFGKARETYQAVLALDAEWQPAAEALARVNAAIGQLTFEQRMTEGFDALAAGELAAARAAFEAAQRMRPGSPQPADGLLQVDQAARLQRIRVLETRAAEEEADERWEAAADTYSEILDVDGDLAFAQEGLARATQRARLHERLQGYIEDPDSLSVPENMQAATNLLLELSRISPTGPRLEDQKETLARLLKRAATPLTVTLRSDSQTEVAIYRVGRLGTFATREIQLRPGNYVAVGSRPGYRDVRIEFRVAPEIDMAPLTVICEEPI